MTDKLAQLRQLLKEHQLDAYIQPVHDEWMSEYPPACNRRVEWLTDFSGSAGVVVVAATCAALITDGRYTLQARAQVLADYQVVNSAETSLHQWLKANMGSKAKIGYDPRLYSSNFAKKLADDGFAPMQTANFIDMLWQNRPPAPASQVFIHELKYSGKSHAEKRALIAAIIKKSGANAAFLAAPESVNWLLNLRARDTENTPLLLANAIISSDGKVELFVDEKRLDAAVKNHLGNEVIISPPLAAPLANYGSKKIIYDPQTTSAFISDLLEKSGAILQTGKDPCLLPKAVKNELEIAGMRRAHIRDGAAVVKLLCWLDEQLKAKKNISEMEVADKLLALRQQNELFVEPSFDTIAGSGANGAIVHYRATAESNRTLQQGELLLLDSGGQYYDGTTDITRTVALGELASNTLSSEQKKRFSQVLKGHIALARAVFPEGTKGSQLDALARQFLWQDGVDYDHGTGHGVGCFLGVHEPPQRISKRSSDYTAIVSGMVLSNEPGYYAEGKYGIRTENLVVVVACPNGLAFDTITCAPIDKNLIERERLTVDEKNWLDNYHQFVLKNLLPLLDKHEQEWLKNACAAL